MTHAHNMSRTWLGVALAVTVAVVMTLGACSGITMNPTSSSNSTNSANTSTRQTFTPKNGNATATLNVASGSENKEVAAAIQKAVDDSGVAVTMNYMGSVDIMQVLQRGGDKYDAVWPANSMWISMGDTRHIVKDQQSTSTTPIVFGIAKSKAISLGWANADGTTKPVSTSDVIAAVQSHKLTFSMTSATQSNSGVSAYLAFLTALSNKQQALTASDLTNTTLRNSAKTLLSGVNRSSGSSDWLKAMVVADSSRFDSMVNYESLVIAANKQLTAKGRDPLLAVYPSDGIAISDSPLGYVDRGQNLDAAFQKFSSALQSKASKLLFEQAGRRTGLGGVLANPTDSQVQGAFRKDWGINTSSNALKAIAMPSASVIRQALQIYQQDLRKPSWTVWVVDYSGSMAGNGHDGVVRGLTSALDPKQAAASMIQPGSNDVNVFIPFSSTAGTPVTAKGTDTSVILKNSNDLQANGGTDIYDGLKKALGVLPSNPSQYTVAIVLMTDGQSQTGNRSSFTSLYQSSSIKPPIFSIMFGDADPSQLDELAKQSNAKVFDGRSGDLAAVFRQVKGYN